jgi:putative spermidine/putrescine transport system permease protein
MLILLKKAGWNMWLKIKPYVLVLPTIGAIVLLFCGGLFGGLLHSFGYFPAAGQDEFHIQAYERLLHSDDFWDSLLLTLCVAAVSSIAAGVLGFAISIGLLMMGQSVKSRLLYRIYQWPLTIPHLVGAYLMVLLFMQSGWLSSILACFGFIEEMTDFPVLINERQGFGIILAYVWKEAPFVSLMVYPVLVRIHGSWREAARVFGANDWKFIRHIVLPLVMPAWISATFIVFAFTFSAFEVPYLLGVTYPRLLPVYSFQLYTSGALADRPEALAVNVLIAVMTAVLGLVAYRLSKRWSTGEERGWE